MFFELMVGAPRSLASPSRGTTVDVLQISGSRSQTSGNASQGSTMVHTTVTMHAVSRMIFLQSFFESLRY
jgi:hypothetical protein